MFLSVFQLHSKFTVLFSIIHTRLLFISYTIPQCISTYSHIKQRQILFFHNLPEIYLFIVQYLNKFFLFFPLDANVSVYFLTLYKCFCLFFNNIEYLLSIFQPHTHIYVHVEYVFNKNLSQYWEVPARIFGVLEVSFHRLLPLEVLYHCSFDYPRSLSIALIRAHHCCSSLQVGYPRL